MPHQHHHLSLELRSHQELGENEPHQHHHLFLELRSHQELGRAGLHQHRLCLQLRRHQGGSVPHQHCHLSLELRSHQGLGDNVLDQHHLCPEPMSHQRLRRHMPHQDHPCQLPPCLGLMSHQRLRCHTPHQDHPCQHPPCPALNPRQCPACHRPQQQQPAPEPMAQQRLRCPMSQQHHPEPRARHQRVTSAVTTRQASTGSAAPRRPGPPQRAVRGCRLSSSPCPCHGLAPVTLGLGEGARTPGMESSTREREGMGTPRPYCHGGLPTATAPAGSDWGWPQSGMGHPLRSALSFFCLIFFSTEEMLY